jgi:hypothetical protein
MGKVIELENEVQNLKNELKEIKNLLINRNWVDTWAPTQTTSKKI